MPIDPLGSVGINSFPIQLIAAPHLPNPSSGLYFSYALVVISDAVKNGTFLLIATYADPEYAGIFDESNLFCAVVVVVVVAFVAVVVTCVVVWGATTVESVLFELLLLLDDDSGVLLVVELSDDKLSSFIDEVSTALEVLADFESTCEMLSIKLQLDDDMQIAADNNRDMSLRLRLLIVI